MRLLLQIANLVSIGLFASLAFGAYLRWEKEGYRFQQWYFILAAAVTISTTWSYLIWAVLDVTGTARSINTAIVGISYVLEIVCFVYIQLQLRGTLKIQTWTNEELKTAYVTEAQNWGRDFANHQNRQSKESISVEARFKMIYWEIQRRDPQLNLLLPLLNSEIDSVRLVAAGHLLKKDPKKSIPILRDVRSRGGALGDVANKLLYESNSESKSR